MGRIHDISPLVTSDLAVWPGDTPPTREVLLDMARGDNLTLSTLRATVHLGAHADAPSHYGRRAPTIEAAELETYLGPVEVLHVEVPRGSRVGPAALARTLRAPRVLFATGTFPDCRRFNTDFAALAPELIEALAGQGVRLVGIDTPSVDLFEAKDLVAHLACLRNRISILEGLRLEGVAPGLYELIALPLRLEGFDASPVRAVLRAADGT